MNRIYGKTKLFYKIIQLTVCLFFIYSESYSQQLSLPLNHQMQIMVNKALNKKTEIHTAFKPLLFSSVKNTSLDSSSILNIPKDTFLGEKFRNSWLWRKIRREGLLRYSHNDIYLEFNPLFDFTFDNENHPSIAGMPLAVNSRGFEVKGNLGKKFSFYTDFYENQAFFPDYLTQYVRYRVVVPGQGVPKPSQTVGFDYATSSGYVSWTPCKYFNLQAGHGKTFVGEGYRSLLLSDNAMSYPFARFTLNFNKFQFTAMFTEFYNYYTMWPWHWFYRHRKAGSFSYLSYKPFTWLEAGLFEGIIWKSLDEKENYKLNASYFFPVPLLQEAIWGYGNSKNNLITGINLKISPSENTQLYGQLMLDNPELKGGGDSYKNRYGYQAGVKLFDALFNAIPNAYLYLQGEYNNVRPFSYSASNPLLSYSDMNQPLAHPLGAGFNEKVLIAHAQWKDFYVEGKITTAVYSADTSANYGTNIFISDESNVAKTELKTGQNSKTTLTYITVKAGIVLNPITNLQLFVGADLRKLDGATSSSSKYIYFGIRTNLRNYYYEVKK